MFFKHAEITTFCIVRRLGVIREKFEHLRKFSSFSLSKLGQKPESVANSQDSYLGSSKDIKTPSSLGRFFGKHMSNLMGYTKLLQSTC